jgi:predicted ATP-dependent endonuclease of OLD family
MLVKRIAIENVRSFLERQELVLDGPISIIIGPNGGGKTNLLDTIVAMLRRYLFASGYLVERDHGNRVMRWGIEANDQLNGHILEKHSAAQDRPQLVEIEIEVSAVDLAGMAAIKNDGPSLVEKSKRDFVENPWDEAKTGISMLSDQATG